MPVSAIHLPAIPLMFICIPNGGNLDFVFFMPMGAESGQILVRGHNYTIDFDGKEVAVRLGSWKCSLKGQIRKVGKGGKEGTDHYVWWEDRTDQPVTYLTYSRASAAALTTCKSIRTLIALSEPST